MIKCGHGDVGSVDGEAFATHVLALQFTPVCRRPCSIPPLPFSSLNGVAVDKQVLVFGCHARAACSEGEISAVTVDTSRTSSAHDAAR